MENALSGSLASIPYYSGTSEYGKQFVDAPVYTFDKVNPAYALYLSSEGGKEVLKVDKEGIIYNGERVKDAGEAYAAIMQFFTKVNK